MTVVGNLPALTAAAGATPNASSAILLVDDNAAKRTAISAVLTQLGYPIVEADSGQAALRCLLVQDFAVILLDVCMPVMDGFETAALIRQRRQSEMTPIIFITAFASDEIAQVDRYVEGAVDFIFAPVPPDELRAKVSVFVNLHAKAESLATQAREVQTSADQLRLLTDAAPIGIFQTDAANRYLYTNPRWSEITGIPADEAIGQEWDAIVSSELRAGLIDELADGPLYRAERCHRFEIRLPGSATRIFQVTSKPVPGTGGSVAGWVGTLADVTAEAGAEAALSFARDEATEASQMKSDFLANMSHEIRTPMNGVIGMTDLLLETELSARQREYAQTVRNSSEALLTIINDILDFSKVEAGMLDIEDVDFNLRTIISDVVDLLAGSAQAKGLELVAVVGSSVPAVIGGDPGRIRQVLTNLIGNAVKFTQTGEIIIRVTAQAPDQAGGETVVRFEICDTGDGIAPGKLASIFEPFVQADSSNSRKYGGTGLGLAISGQLVALMGGSCGVASQPDIGSTFWFTVSVHAAAGQRADDSLSPDAGLAGVTALVVDDNATQRSVLTHYLTSWGLQVATAESGPAALAALRTASDQARPVAVTLIDRSMPEMDGLQLRDAILADPALATRIVLLTGLGQDAELAAEAGVGAIASKPVHPEQLQECLRTALGLQERVSRDHADPAVPEPRSDGEPVRDRLLLAEDNPINQKVALAMLAGAGFVVDSVHNGVAAVEAVASRNYKAILMDCQMPEMNGYEATAAIRAHEGADRHTPIIAMTAGARREDRERCLAEGMDAYLAKPVSKDALIAIVSRAVTTGFEVQQPDPAG